MRILLCCAVMLVCFKASATIVAVRNLVELDNLQLLEDQNLTSQIFETSLGLVETKGRHDDYGVSEEYICTPKGKWLIGLPMAMAEYGQDFIHDVTIIGEELYLIGLHSIWKYNSKYDNFRVVIGPGERCQFWPDLLIGPAISSSKDKFFIFSNEELPELMGIIEFIPDKYGWVPSCSEDPEFYAEVLQEWLVHWIPAS